MAMATKGRRYLTTSQPSHGGANGSKKKKRPTKKKKKRTDAKQQNENGKGATPVNSKPESESTHLGSVTSSTATTNPTTSPVGSIQLADPSPSAILDDVTRMIQELQTINSHDGKRDILARYAPLAPTLQWTYDPYRQFHVKSSSIIKYALAKSNAVNAEGPQGANPDDSRRNSSSDNSSTQSLWTSGVVYNTLQELLEALSSRSATGYKAKDSVMLFLDRFCRESTPRPLVGQDSIQQLLRSPRSLTLFKIIDKNLKAGCSSGFINVAFPGLIPRFHVALGNSLLHLDDARKLFPSPLSTMLPSQHHDTDRIEVEGADAGKRRKKGRAVGKKETTLATTPPATIMTASSTSSASSAPAAASIGTDSPNAWFGSRKLDGVRCLITVNLATGEAEAVSRSGRPFETLGEIEAAVAEMVGGNSLEERRKFFAIATGGTTETVSTDITTTMATMTTMADVKEMSKSNKKKEKEKNNDPAVLSSSHRQDLPSSLVFDGEICVLDASQMTRTPLSGDHGGKEQKGDGAEEDGPFDFDHGGIGHECFSQTVGVGTDSLKGKKEEEERQEI
ncbi:hypothetical protein DFQ26_006215 [Actinomortierella ambigua]|nr:hypothetical protein DFQ26_006215 [Actinomortierella ambigua]